MSVLDNRIKYPKLFDYCLYLVNTDIFIMLYNEIIYDKEGLP